MSKWNVGLVAIAAAVIAVGSAATARADDTIDAKVPFAFMVGTTRLPAGEYVVSRKSDDPVVETIASADGQTLIYRLTIPWDPVVAPRHAKLVFARLGHEYFLSRIDPVDGDGREIAMTPAQMEHAMVRVEDAGH